MDQSYLISLYIIIIYKDFSTKVLILIYYITETNHLWVSLCEVILTVCCMQGINEKCPIGMIKPQILVYVVCHKSYLIL